jgi:hypothetical protein
LPQNGARDGARPRGELARGNDVERHGAGIEILLEDVDRLKDK